MATEFVVDGKHEGYVFVGSSSGVFKTNEGEQRRFVNMFVISPLNTNNNGQVSNYGYKAEKLKCIDTEVYKDLTPGDTIRVFFDQYGRAVSTALDG